MRVSKVSLLLRSVSGASAEEPCPQFYWGGLFRVAVSCRCDRHSRVASAIMRYGADSSTHARKMTSQFPLVCATSIIGMEVNAVTDAVNLGRICQQHPSATGAPLPNNEASPLKRMGAESGECNSHGLIAKPVGGRPSRNRKRPTDHVGAYPRARAFPAVPPSPPLVMQRHRILSRDGEASRRILVPQIDFTLLSPSAGGDTNLPAL